MGTDEFKDQMYDVLHRDMGGGAGAAAAAGCHTCMHDGLHRAGGRAWLLRPMLKPWSKAV